MLTIATPRVAEIHAELREIDQRCSDLGNTDSMSQEAGVEMDRLIRRHKELVDSLEPIREKQWKGIREKAATYVKPRKGRKPSVKTVKHMGRSCYCGKDVFNDTGKPVKRPLRVYKAEDLCHRGPDGNETRQCEVYQLYRESLRTGRHPVEFVRERHLFEPSPEDREHLEGECLKHCLDWLRDHERVCFRGRTEFDSFADFLLCYLGCGAAAAHEAWAGRVK